jgi:hypothetical protein
MCAAHRRKRQTRKMTNTEHRGYLKHHEGVEDPEFRERAKTAEARETCAKEQQRLESDWRNALVDQDKAALEDLESDVRVLERKAGSIRTRKNRLKKMSRLESDN